MYLFLHGHLVRLGIRVRSRSSDPSARSTPGSPGPAARRRCRPTWSCPCLVTRTPAISSSGTAGTLTFSSRPRRQPLLVHQHRQPRGEPRGRREIRLAVRGQRHRDGRDPQDRPLRRRRDRPRVDDVDRRVRPWLIPETSRSGFPSRDTCTPSFTASAGVPSTA